MKQTLTISGRFDALNEMLAAARARRGKRGSAYSLMKKKWTDVVIAECSIQKITPMKGRFRISITVYEPDKRRDPDNIAAGAFKFILDGLVKAGIIIDDSQKYLQDMVFAVGSPDKHNPRVVATLEGVDDES